MRTPLMWARWRSRRVPVHPGSAGVQQDRTCAAAVDGAVDGAADGGRQRDQDHLGALAAYPEHAMAVFLAEVGNVRAGGFEDPEAEQSEHDEREVAWVDGLAAGGQHRFELQVR